MQETSYRVAFPLYSEPVEKRLELLKKMELFKDELKKKGHAGQIKNMTCHVSDPRNAVCLVTVQHPEENAWFIPEYERIQTSESGIKTRLKETINDEIKKLNDMAPEEQIKYLKNIKDSELQRYGILPEDRAKYGEPDDFIKKLEDTRETPEVFKTFQIRALYMDPLKPSKKELENETQYVEKLTATNYKKINKTIIENFKNKNNFTEPKKVTPLTFELKEQLEAEKKKRFADWDAKLDAAKKLKKE